MVGDGKSWGREPAGFSCSRWPHDLFYLPELCWLCSHGTSSYMVTKRLNKTSTVEGVPLPATSQSAAPSSGVGHTAPSGATPLRVASEVELLFPSKEKGQEGMFWDRRQLPKQTKMP